MNPLDGIRILSLAEQYPGPYATAVLADLGADVVLVERPGTGDPSRVDRGFFSALNRGKRSVALDLKQDTQKRALLSLVERCDAVLEGFRPGVAERLGIDYRSLLAVNPRLIYASISAFGQSGPYRDRPAHDLSLQAIAGLLHERTNRATDYPYVAWGDLSAGMFAAIGVLAGLVQRERTGTGVEIDVSMVDTLVSCMSVILGPSLNGLRPLQPHQPGYGCYQCADGAWLSVSILNEDHLWHDLADAIGLTDLVKLSSEQREARFDELGAALSARFLSKTRAAWSQVLNSKNIAWGPVLAPAEMADDPHLQARGMILRLRDGSWGVSQPLKFDGKRPAQMEPAPSLGQHDAESIWR